MSMESELARIATALEALVGIKKESAPDIEPPKKAAVVKAPPAAVAQPVAAKEDVIPAPGATTPVEDPTAAPASLEMVLMALRQYADLQGADKAKALMVKYGADPKAPKSKDIKPINYAKVLKEIKES